MTRLVFLALATMLIVAVALASSPALAGGVKGKLGYMAPEQIRGEELDGRADLFAAALILYRLVTGFNPYNKQENETEIALAIRVRDAGVPAPRKVEPSLDPMIDTFLRKALQRKPSKRYDSCDAFVFELENYVIAKDDIGNWYVKNYSADTEPIIKAAKSLALFGMGGQMGTNLLGSQDDQAGGAAPASGGAPLERLFEKHREKYTTRTEKDYADLVAMIEGKGIAARIEQAVESRAGDLGTVKVQVDQALARSQGVLELDLKDSKKADAETRTGTKIVRVLNSVKSFHTGLKGEIAELKPADDAQKAALEGVTRDVTTIVRGILNDMIARRRDAVQDYESSVIFIGDATKG